jgi:hypothetical protein
MPEEPSLDPMKNLWQKQAVEPPQISIGRFQHKARKLQRKARREIYTLYAMALVCASLLVFAFGSIQGAAHRIGLGILIVWALLLPFQAHRKLWTSHAAAEATLAATMDFYRGQLMRHSDYGKYLWRWGVLPLFAGVAVFLSPHAAGIAENPKLISKVLPFLLLLAVWTAAFFYLRRHKLRKLRRKLDMLDELEKKISG